MLVVLISKCISSVSTKKKKKKKISWMEEPGSLQSMGSQSDTTERLHFRLFSSCGERGLLFVGCAGHGLLIAADSLVVKQRL